jgi:cytochrome c peroxidase
MKLRTLILLCSFWAAVGSTAAPAFAQQLSLAAAHQTPGMTVIARIARNVAILSGILKGEIPKAIEQDVRFRDPTGWIGTYQPGGRTITATNGFFSSDITTNERTCFTCHQPQNGWAISPPSILAQYLLTRGQSALFQPIDAAVCPDAPGAAARFLDPRFVKSRAQLFKRGNFRISLNAPNPLGPADESYMTFDGNTNPEWALRVDYDPFGCELDPEYGLPANVLSVYRRPLPSANVAFLAQNGKESKLDIMWDAREPNLETQFINATLFHGQTTVTPDSSIVAQGVQFQSGLFTGQTYDNLAGDLTGGDGSGAEGGPINLYNSRFDETTSLCTIDEFCPSVKVKHTLSAPVILPDGTVLVDGSGNPIDFSANLGSALYTAFATPTNGNRLQKAQRESIARGEAIFSGKVFIINKVAGLNDIKGDADGTEPGTCSTCHSNMNVQNDTAADPKRLGIMDNSSGVNVMPWTPDFPRFAFYCESGGIPFFSNPVTSPDCPGSTPGNPATCDKFITTDPGKGLITGLCQDLGKMKVPILHGLASRAPYFHGGNAATLLDVVNFYNQRFNIQLTLQEKKDLVNYLNSL